MLAQECYVIQVQAQEQLPHSFVQMLQVLSLRSACLGTRIVRVESCWRMF